MQIARSLMSLLMIVIVLPWGAYASGFSASAPAARQAVYVAAKIENALGKEVIVQTPSSAKVSMNKKCRTATLPGSLCGPDQALSGTTATSLTRPLPTVSVLIADWRVHGRNHAPPRDPPRFF